MKWRRRVLGAAGLCAFAALALWTLDLIALQLIVPAPPALDSEPEILGTRLETDSDGALRLGPCWRREHRGQHLLYVEGDPFTLGYCNSRLLGPIMARQEAALHDALETFLPFRPLRHVVVRSLGWIYRNLPEHLTESERMEIFGIARGYEDPWRHLGPTYGRIVFYHAIHDISQAMVDSPLLACTAFAATGTATSDGHTLLARDFDFEGGRVFDEDKVILVYRPQFGIPFISVVWAGMAGAVSGLNAEGIGVTLNAAGSDDFDTEGRPTTLMVRSILQNAKSLDEAIAIVEASDVFVSDILTVADGKTGEMAVIELTPRRVKVRRPESDVIYATNHFVHPGFAGDQENRSRMDDGTTVSRFDRLRELVEDRSAPIDPAQAAAILRDRRLPGGIAAGLGHRGTIDALIATHAVVFDLTSRTLWVSSSPHTLGELVEYRLDELIDGQVLDHGALAEDSLLGSGGWERYERARHLLERDDISASKEALTLVPDHPPALLKLATLCDATDDRACARDAYRRFLDTHPPYRKNADHARQRLVALEAE